MKLFTYFMQWPVYGAVIFLFFIRAWSMFITHDMLRTIFDSAVGKRKRHYIEHVGIIGKIYRTYIVRITLYCQRITRYLITNNIVASIASIVSVALLALNYAGADSLSHATKIYIAVVIVLVEVPPIILSCLFTSYSGGHPHYRFDLNSDFIGEKQLERKKRLLIEKRNGLIMTSDEFSRVKRKM